MKKISLFILLFFCVLQLQGQQTQVVDSLQQVLQTAESDTLKAFLFYELGDQWTYADTTKALYYNSRGLGLTAKYPFYEAMGHFYRGRIYMEYDLDKGSEEFSTSIRIFEKITTPASFVYQSRAWVNKANIFQQKNDNEKFITLMLNKAIPLAAKAGDSIHVAMDYTNVALPFMNYGNYDKAIYYLLKSVQLFQRNDPSNLRQVDNYTNLAKTYLLKLDYPAAKKNLDSALNILKQDPECLYAPYYYTIEGMYYTDLKLWDQSEKSLNKGLVIAEKMKSKYDIRILLYQKARLYDGKKDRRAARDILLKMYKEGYIVQDGDKKQIYHDLAVTEAELGNIKSAYDWLMKYSIFADSLYEKQTNLQIADLETKYNYAQKEKELLVVNNKVKMQRMLMWGSIGGLFLGLIAFIYLYQLRKIKAAQEVQSLKQQQQIALANALLQGEEKERTRMARDLHDGLGGMLAGVKINLTNVLQENTSAEMNRVIEQLDSSVTELRRIARNMMPEGLLRSGLETALTDLCQSLSTDTLQLEFSFMNISSTIPKQTQIIIYRIIQELLTNIVKHSNANEAFLQCSQEENNLYITVEDNGKGFDATAATTQKGLGLENIRSRVDFLKGKMDLKSISGKGTVVNIELKTNGQG